MKGTKQAPRANPRLAAGARRGQDRSWRRVGWGNLLSFEKCDAAGWRLIVQWEREGVDREKFEDCAGVQGATYSRAHQTQSRQPQHRGRCHQRPGPLCRPAPFHHPSSTRPRRVENAKGQSSWKDRRNFQFLFLRKFYCDKTDRFDSKERRIPRLEFPGTRSLLTNHIKSATSRRLRYYPRTYSPTPFWEDA